MCVTRPQGPEGKDEVLACCKLRLLSCFCLGSFVLTIVLCLFWGLLLGSLRLAGSEVRELFPAITS